MAVTLTGSKYSGSITSYSAFQLTTSGATFIAGDFNVPRMVAIFNGSNLFKGIAYVRAFVSATVLQLEYDPFDPVTNQSITVLGTDAFDVSLNLSEVAAAGLTVTNTEVTVSDQLLFGTAGDQRSLCLYDEDKDLRQTAGAAWETLGGVVAFGHLLGINSTNYANPVNMAFNSSGVRFKTNGTSSHFFWFGGSLFAQSTPAYVGGYLGSAAGSMVLSRVAVSEMDLISANVGGVWGANNLRHVLRDVTTYISKNNAIGIRWGDGVIEGGGAKAKTTAPLAIFGGNLVIDVGAPPDSRYIVSDIAGNSIHDAGAGVNFTNLICSDRGSSRPGQGGSPEPQLNYFWENTYSNLIEGSKVIVNRTVDSTEVHNDTVGADGVSTPRIFEALFRRNVGITVYSAWTYGIAEYLSTLITGDIVTSQYDLGAAGSSNEVNFGGVVVQPVDLSITESTKATVDAYPITAALVGSTLTITGDAVTLQSITAAQLYDFVKSYLVDNYAGETETIITREGVTIDGRALDIVLDYITYTGNITTTGAITLSNGSTISGYQEDASGATSIVTFTGLTIGDIIYIEDNAQVQQFFTTATATSENFIIPFGNDGEVWRYSIDKAGYTPAVGGFTVAGATVQSIAVNLLQYLKADGSPMYTGSTSANVAIIFDLVTPQATIEIGDAVVSAQVIFDEFEDALLTAAGMAWHAQQTTVVTHDDLPGVGPILFMQADIRVRSDNILSTNSGVSGYIQSTDGTPVDGSNGPVAYVGGLNAADIAAATYTEFTDGANADAFKATGFATPTNVSDAETAILADIAGLNDFDPATDAVANVTLVATCTTNTDMRGTDNALLASGYTAPDNAGIAANGVAIGNLNDFDPANDVVANVTLVDTCTTNTDMRGTDGANTTAPDNTGIADIQTDIAALNDFNPATDTVKANVEQVTGVVITGSGVESDPWGPDV